MGKVSFHSTAKDSDFIKPGKFNNFGLMSLLTEEAKQWFRLKYGVTLSSVSDKECLFGAIDDYLIAQITAKIYEIRNNKGVGNFRIGILGRKPRSVEQSFVSYPFSEMHLLYKSKIFDQVGGLERHYMRIYEDQKIVNLLGYDQTRVISFNGFYYLYLLV